MTSQLIAARMSNMVPRILIVDDDPALQELIRMILAQIACEISVCGTVAQARQRFQDAPPDLVILDISLPDGNGMDLYEELIAKHRGGTRFMFLTARIDMQSLLRCYGLGAQDFISKPFAAEALLAHVKVHLSNKRSQDELARCNQELELHDHVLQAATNGMAHDLGKLLQEPRAMYQALFVGSPEGIIVTDVKTMKILHANPAACSMFDYTQEELMRLGLENLHPKELSDCAKAELAVQARGEKILPLDLPCLRKDGTLFYANVSVVLLVIDGRKCSVDFFRDTTERRRIAEQLAQSRKELERSNKDLEQFAYIASHDLQEPLRAVAGYVQLLAKRYKGKLDKDADEFIDYAVEGTIRMQGMIGDLLAFSRVSSQKRVELVSSEKIFKRTLENLKLPIAETKTSVTFDPLPDVTVDPLHLMQLFQNLIENAIKFRGKDAPRLHVSCKEDGREWVFSVQDNSIGIEAQYFDKIFLIFQRLYPRQKYPGNGIGLALCKKIMAYYGGRIWVESRLGEGSTFYFAFPVNNSQQDMNGG